MWIDDFTLRTYLRKDGFWPSDGRHRARAISRDEARTRALFEMRRPLR